jgi:membrane-bound lytic murein transglycosylase F
LIRRFIIQIIFLAVIFNSCTDFQGSSNKANSVSFDLDSIRARGKLIAVTDFNSTSYFLYKGEPMGFHYELLKMFAEHLDVDLEIIKENQIEDSFGFLQRGEADLLAMGLTVSTSGKKEILFSDPLTVTRQVLVQLKPRTWRSMTEDGISKMLVRNQLDLAGKNIYVQQGSSHTARLHNLANEIGDSINIIEVPYGPEELIRNVAKGEIEYTVCDEYIAAVNATYFPDIDINTAVSFPQKIAWGVRKENSGKLLLELNNWLNSYKSTRSFALLYAKYFRNTRSGTIVKSDYYSLNTGRISRWDDLIRNECSKIEWDWRLLSSLIYQESRFNPDVSSRAGAYGLMQVLPSTGSHFGIDITSSPVANIRAGIKYIAWLHTIFDVRIPETSERLKFILASYNAGPGHVLDAMNLAAKYGDDPLVWGNNVEVWLQKKSDPRYYNDPLVKSGFFKGTESVKFVTEILDRYEHYRNIVPETPVNNLNLGMVSK